ncbi:MAG: hypothetical protein AB7O59_24305 [Pirellulales bacterium]
MLSPLAPALRQELVDENGTLSNLDFFVLTLTQFGNAGQQLRDLYAVTLADLEANYPAYDFALTATQSPFDFLGLEVYELFGGELLPPPNPPPRGNP